MECKKVEQKKSTQEIFTGYFIQEIQTYSQHMAHSSQLAAFS